MLFETSCEAGAQACDGKRDRLLVQSPIAGNEILSMKNFRCVALISPLNAQCLQNSAESGKRKCLNGNRVS